jgi:hypothetical protein
VGLAAALPPDVRKGFAFPLVTKKDERLRLERKRGRSHELGGAVAGRAEPFRTSGGKAAKEFEELCVKLQVNELENFS